MKNLLLLAIASWSLIGCVDALNQNVTDGSINNDEIKTSKYNVNSFSMNKLVCDPFQDTSPTATGGLKAKLYTMPNGEHPSSLAPYFSTGVMSTQDLYFSEVNVPTRIFSLGFPSETGEEIKTDTGEVINEWFALRLNSVLKLGPNDEEGDYELALLSDDGATLSIKDENGNFVLAVDNDGLHPTRMGCGAVVNMTASTKLTVQIDYYQGPRWHISVIPMWRKVDSSTTPEVKCGVSGNNTFFDFNNNSEPQPTYLGLLDRGWKPISAENWEIEDSNQGGFNPCTEGEALAISDYNVSVFEESFVIVTWKTDKPATSQVIYKNQTTGEEITTTSDNLLRTEHTVFIDIPGRVDPYEFTAVSVGEDLGKAMSEVFILQP